MTPNERRALLDELKECLSSYLDIERRVLGQRLFETVPYADLKGSLDRTIAETERIGGTWRAEGTQSTVATYIEHLVQAMRAPETIIEGLARKAEARSRYGWLTYRRDQKAYRRRVDRYTRYGPAVNAAYEALTQDQSADEPDPAEIAAMIRVVSFHEMRELAARWGTSIETLGLAKMITEYASFLFRVTDLLAFARYGDPRRVALMRDVAGALAAQLLASLGDTPETRRMTLATLDDEEGVYSMCRSVSGEHSIIAAAAGRFQSYAGAMPANELVEALTAAVVGITATRPFAPLAARSRS